MAKLWMTLVHRTERRFSWLVLGAILLAIGLWVMMGAAQSARVRRLFCRQSLYGQTACQVDLVWLGVTLRQTPLSLLEVAVEPDQAGQMTLLLITPDGSFPFPMPGADAARLWTEADRVNDFLKQADGTELTLQAGGAYERLPVGLAGSILAALGFFLIVFGWRVVVGLTHEGGTAGVAFSPRHQVLVSGGLDQQVHQWDGQDGRLLSSELGFGGPISDVAFSPDGRLVAVTCWDQTVDLRPAELMADMFALTQTLEVEGAAFLALAFSPDGQILAAGTTDHAVHLWQLTDYTLLATLSGHSGPVVDLAFSPDGQTLLSASADGTVRLWSWAEGQTRLTLNHPEAVTCLAVSPDGQTVAAGGVDHQIRLWRTSDGTLRQTLTGHTNLVRDLAFSPDTAPFGVRLISGSSDGTVRLWSMDDQAEGRVIVEQPGEITTVAVSPDGSLLAAGSNYESVRLWLLTAES